MVAALLLVALAQAPIGEPEDQPAVELGKAPQPDPWTQDLPKAIMLDGGTCLPSPLDKEVSARLIFLDGTYPRLCQQAIDLYADFLIKFADNEMRKLRVACAENVAEVEKQRDAGFSFWVVVAIGVGAGLVGFGGGALVAASRGG